MTVATPAKFRSRKRILARLAALKLERTPHEADWRNITNFIRPSRGQYLFGQEASKLPTSLINATPYVASRTLSAGMLSGASSPAYQWFKFIIDDEDLGKWGPAKEFLEACEMKLLQVLAQSNFYQNLQTLYGDAADFGTGAAILDESENDVINLRLMSPGEYWIDVNDEGDFSTLYREYQMTVLQLMKKYKDSVSSYVKDEYERGNYQTRVRVIEAIEENEEYEEGKSDWTGMPFTQFTLEQVVSGNPSDEAFLSVKGYREWPVPNVRWDLASGNKWGWGPGLVAVGDSKALQTFEFRRAQAIEKAVTPPLIAPTILKNKPISHAPGGVTFVDAYNQNATVAPIYAMSPGILQAISNDILNKEMKINEIYYKDLFLMLATSDRREITAREVEEKHQEKLLALGPVLGRTHRDALDIAIIRTYQIMKRRGMFGEPPEELRERLLGIRYTSALAYAQRASGAASIERFFGFAGNLMPVFPQIRHKVDINSAIDEYADNIGVPAKVMVNSKKAAEAADSEARAAQAQQAAETAPGMAQAAKLLSETDTTRPSALDFIRQRSGV